MALDPIYWIFKSYEIIYINSLLSLVGSSLIVVNEVFVDFSEILFMYFLVDQIHLQSLEHLFSLCFIPFF